MASGIKSVKGYFEYYTDSEDETSMTFCFAKPIAKIAKVDVDTIRIYDINITDFMNLIISETEDMNNNNATFADTEEILEYLKANQ